MAKQTPVPELRQLPIGALTVDPNQPRRDFGLELGSKQTMEPLEALAASIREQGILQPILARPIGKNKFMIIAGERRWRAAEMAGLKSVPVLVREDLEGLSLELAQLTENIQREDLTDNDISIAIESLLARYPELMKKDVAILLRRHPSYVTRMLAMQSPEYKKEIKEGLIQHASVLEQFKSLPKHVQEKLLQSAREWGKPVSHIAIAAARKEAADSMRGAKVSGEHYQKLMDLGLTAHAPLRMTPSGSDDFIPPVGARPASASRVGSILESRANNAPREMVHQARMGWDQFSALWNVSPPAASPTMVEVMLTSDEIRSALRQLGRQVPRDEMDQLPSLLEALRHVKPVEKAKKPAAKKSITARSTR